MDGLRPMILFLPLALLAGAIAAEAFRRASMWPRTAVASLATACVAAWLATRGASMTPALPWVAALYLGLVTGALWEPLTRR